jgi:hypothetical protein
VVLLCAEGEDLFWLKLSLFSSTLTLTAVLRDEQEILYDQFGAVVG